jgi:hypothetical protein
MNAAEIACALGDAHREGQGWRCRCPLHGGQSLVLRDGDGGRVLLWCWGGCDRFDILAELRRRGLLGGERETMRPSSPFELRRASLIMMRSASYARAASGRKRLTRAEARSPAILLAARWSSTHGPHHCACTRAARARTARLLRRWWPQWSTSRAGSSASTAPI